MESDEAYLGVGHSLSFDVLTAAPIDIFDPPTGRFESGGLMPGGSYLRVAVSATPLRGVGDSS
jgi:hypothetical protein